MVHQGLEEKWVLLNSDAIEFEISRNPDPFKKEQLESILSVATRRLPSSEAIKLRATALMELGFKLYYQISKSMTDIHARMLAKPAFVVTRIKKNGILLVNFSHLW
jgi:hypothetical protein